MGTKFEVDNDGVVKLPSLSSDPSSPSEAQIYYNSTDKKIKVYNGTSFEELGSSGTAFWLDSNQYTVYDDFDSYSTGTFSSNSNWTISSANQANAYITASNNAGGSTNELDLRINSNNASNNTITATSLLIPSNRHIFARCAAIYGNWPDDGFNPDLQISIGNATDGYTIIIDKFDGWFVNGSVEIPNDYFDVFIVAKGSNTYDAYWGGKKVQSNLSLPNGCQLRFYLKIDTVSVANYTSHLYVDDVRYSNNEVS